MAFIVQFLLPYNVAWNDVAFLYEKLSESGRTEPAYIFKIAIRPTSDDNKLYFGTLAMWSLKTFPFFIFTQIVVEPVEKA